MSLNPHGSTHGTLCSWQNEPTTNVKSVQILQELNTEKYTFTSGYFNWFPVVRKLQSLHLMSVIKHLKEIFTEIGVPRCIFLDGGTQFTWQEFQDFTRRWDTQRRITSPTNAQSNGQAEQFVQTIKNNLTKALAEGKELHLAILSYITRPLNHSVPSPVKLLNSRKFRCFLPLTSRQPNHIWQYRNVMQHQKHEQAKHYNKSVRDLPSLNVTR